MTVLSSRPYITHLITLESSKLHCSQLPRLATEFGHPLVLSFLWPLTCCVWKTRVEFVPSPWTCQNDRCQFWSYVQFAYNTAMPLKGQKKRDSSSLHHRSSHSSNRTATFGLQMVFGRTAPLRVSYSVNASLSC